MCHDSVCEVFPSTTLMSLCSQGQNDDGDKVRGDAVKTSVQRESVKVNEKVQILKTHFTVFTLMLHQPGLFLHRRKLVKI